MNQALHNANSESRILVVDDNPAVLTIVREILVRAGFPVVSAASGEAALSICQEEALAGREISLMILDLTLPGGMTGLEVLETLKRIEPGLRVIASSGYFDESAFQVARRKGFTGILAKPYTAENLLKVVNWALERGTARGSETAEAEFPSVPVRPSHGITA